MPESYSENKENLLCQYFCNCLSLAISDGRPADKILFLRRFFFSFRLASLANALASMSALSSIVVVSNIGAVADASDVACAVETVAISSLKGIDGGELIVDECREGFSAMDSSSDDECINKVVSVFVCKKVGKGERL